VHHLSRSKKADTQFIMINDWFWPEADLADSPLPTRSGRSKEADILFSWPASTGLHLQVNWIWALGQPPHRGSNP